MTSTRVYLTLTPQILDDLARTRAVTGLHATAVTPALREAYPQEDDEGLEFEAMQEAAAASPVDQQVLVAAADLDTNVTPALSSTPAAIELGEVGIDRVVSFHVGDPGETAGPDHVLELSWYDITELDEVRRLFPA